MEQEVLEHLGGRRHLERKLCARSFLIDCVFDNKEIELGFSFRESGGMNFVTFKRLMDGYKYYTKTYYSLYFYKVSWFRVRCVQSMYEVPIEQVKERLGVVLNADL